MDFLMWINIDALKDPLKLFIGNLKMVLLHHFGKLLHRNCSLLILIKCGKSLLKVLQFLRCKTVGQPC